MQLLAALILLSPQASDAKLVTLTDGFVRVETSAYSFEIPKGWAVGRETPWGARDLKPESGTGALSAMTAGPSNAGWDQLYQTSLFFIRREGPGRPTPYKIEQTKQGYEACTFSMVDDQGFANRRYVLLKATSGKVLALSVKIPSKENEKTLQPIFDRFVTSARIY
jgi:hypothetical protein